MRIFVLVPVHNRWSFTQQFIESIDAQELPQDVTVRLVVINDGSRDQTTTELARYAGVHVLNGNGSMWWAGSISRGLAWTVPQMLDQDVVYLANNDTILDRDHLASIVKLMKASRADLVGSISYEIWPSGHRNPVSNAFVIDREKLNVINIRPEDISNSRIDALAGRGLLISASAAKTLRLQPDRLPQHFADIAATAGLIAGGFVATVDVQATAVQLERAGSSVEIRPTLTSMIDKKSQLYLPALAAFWWQQFPPSQRASLLWRFPIRALRRMTGGHYALK